MCIKTHTKTFKMMHAHDVSRSSVYKNLANTNQNIIHLCIYDRVNDDVNPHRFDDSSIQWFLRFH
ncbi:MAG: hypothetical protein CL602_01655 [Alteromonas sp.]|nr:hypothetical protein [Alteromonas sp.]